MSQEIDSDRWGLYTGASLDAVASNIVITSDNALIAGRQSEVIINRADMALYFETPVVMKLEGRELFEIQPDMYPARAACAAACVDRVPPGRAQVEAGMIGEADDLTPEAMASGVRIMIEAHRLRYGRAGNDYEPPRVTPLGSLRTNLAGAGTQPDRPPLEEL